MVRALHDVAVDIFTTETEAVPLDDDDAEDAQRPMPAVTGRRSVAFRQARVKADTFSSGAEGSSEVVGFPLSFGTEPPAAEGARIATGGAVRPAGAPAAASDLDPAVAIAPRSSTARIPRRWLLAAVVAIGGVIGVAVALAGSEGPPPPDVATQPERGPLATTPPASVESPAAGPVEATATPTPPAPTDPVAPVGEAVAAPVDEAVAVDEAVVVDEAIAAPVDEGSEPVVDEAPAAPPLDPRIARIQRQRQKAYQREFDQRKRERLKLLAEQARQNRERAAERQRQYKADFERRKRERLEATLGQ
ncbi:MAG: hypothetical protein CVU56_09715 [Deltaproteobacteria bacterium HGW-Deltaproteobacteria-14]|jgi:hypothetical protein|nr:MAG: hypothetical protein CVU56_09715 [Deltaproteobacteria bacterium HGW-Deltaproteobacteria-14]